MRQGTTRETFKRPCDMLGPIMVCILMAFNLLYDLPLELQALVLDQMLRSYKTRELHRIDHLPFYD